MFKTFKYITAIVLLTVFPISAIGINVSVFKCEHKKTTRYSLLNSISENSKSYECQCVKSEKKIVKTTQHSCCKHKKLHEVNVVEAKVCSVKNHSSKKESGINYRNAPCCSKSNKTLAIKGNVEILEHQNIISELPIFSAIINFYNTPNNNKEDILTNFDFPLKGPITNLISYIHYNSERGDDPVAPFPYYC